MDVKKYIASGILELYVSGGLSPEENLEVQHYAIKHPEIQEEIEAIEKAILRLTAAASPGLPENGFTSIRSELDDVIPFAPSASKKKTPWIHYLGWAASLILAIGLIWVYLENQDLKTEVQMVNGQKQQLKEEILNARELVADKDAIETMLNKLRNRDITVIPLGGQTIAPESYARAYWNKKEKKVYLDVQGLPDPPSGYTYQVWSLKLDPLTPTSIGILDDFVSNETAIFELSNPNESEAFGITLEPEGGSETPTLEQLYTLGAVGP